MGASVLAVSALRADLGLMARDESHYWADIRHPDAVESSLALLHRGNRLVIVTCLAADTDLTLESLTRARVRIPQLTTALLPVCGGPLALTAVSQLIGEHDDMIESSLARQFAAASIARSQAWSAVWTPKPAKVAGARTSLVQSFRSMFSGGSYLVELSGGGAVLSWGKKNPLVRDDRGVTLIHSQDSTGWVADAAATSMAADQVLELDSARDAVDAFGNSRAVELVALPGGLQQLITDVAAQAKECAACGIEHGERVCPVCGMVAQHEVAA